MKRGKGFRNDFYSLVDELTGIVDKQTNLIYDNKIKERIKSKDKEKIDNKLVKNE